MRFRCRLCTINTILLMYYYKISNIKLCKLQKNKNLVKTYCIKYVTAIICTNKILVKIVLYIQCGRTSVFLSTVKSKQVLYLVIISVMR